MTATGSAWRRGLAIVAEICLAAVLSACGGSTKASTHPRDTPTPSRPVDVNSVDPYFDMGQNVFITSTAFRPQWLVAAVNRPIVWTNDTSVTQSIRFDNVSLAPSGPIRPGGTFVYTPTQTLSIVFHLARSPTIMGRVQIQLPGDT